MSNDEESKDIYCMSNASKNLKNDSTSLVDLKVIYGLQKVLLFSAKPRTSVLQQMATKNVSNFVQVKR